MHVEAALLGQLLLTMLDFFAVELLVAISYKEKQVNEKVFRQHLVLQPRLEQVVFHCVRKLLEKQLPQQAFARCALPCAVYRFQTRDTLGLQCGRFEVVDDRVAESHIIQIIARMNIFTRSRDRTSIQSASFGIFSSQCSQSS